MRDIVETSLENTIHCKNYMKEFDGLSPKAMGKLFRLVEQESDICDLCFRICGF